MARKYPDDLGQVPDRVIAEREGVHTTAVHYWRKKLGIPRWMDSTTGVTVRLSPLHLRLLDGLPGETRHDKIATLFSMSLDAGLIGE